MHHLLSKDQSSGFTIVELIIVIAVIGILVTLSIVGYGGFQQSARATSAQADLDSVTAEIARYGTKNNGKLGSGVEWYSANGSNPNIKFTPSTGNVIDIVANATDYCVRVFNPGIEKNSITNAYTKESTPGTCTTLSPSYAAQGKSAPSAWLTVSGSTTLSQGGMNGFALSSNGSKIVGGGWSTTGGDGYIHTSTDGGTTWTQVSGTGPELWEYFASSADGTKLAASVWNGGALYTSSNSGATWTSRMTGKYWMKIISSDSGNNLATIGYLSGSPSRYIYTSTDSGVTWTQQPSAKVWSRLAGSSDLTKLAATVTSGYVFTSTDSGVTWTQQTASGSRSWKAIASSADGTKLAAASDSIYLSTDSGATWTASSTAGVRSWWSIAGSADGQRIVAGVYDGYIYVSGDGGATWLEQTSLGTGRWTATTISRDGTKLIAEDSQSNTLYVANWPL